MEKWQQFEEDCYLFLKKNYSKKGIQFIKYGSADSTCPDIKVELNNNISFCIETKGNNAQCGQFVLIPDEKTKSFIFSEHNKSNCNKYSMSIIEHMNLNFDIYRNAGTKGQKIDMPSKVFFCWIMNYYTSKSVKFFITKKNDFIIFPVEKLDRYFDVTATYRMKKSGSANPSAINQKEVIKTLSNWGCKFSMTNFTRGFFIITSENLDDRKIIGDKYNYIFKKETKNKYRVRQLSNTCNSNVIFSISLKRNQDEEDLKIFESTIR